MLLLHFLIAIAVITVGMASMPLPFTRELSVTSPLLTGNDVKIAQTLLSRDDRVPPSFIVSGTFDESSAAATSAFQSHVGLKVTGVVDSETAQKLLDTHSADGFKDDGFTAASRGYLYKIHIPVHTNRSIETISTLFDKDNNVLMTFTTRTHGHRDDGSSAPWPDFGNGDVGLNQFTSNGDTVTGLIELDLNTPEPDPALYVQLIILYKYIRVIIFFMVLHLHIYVCLSSECISLS